MKKFMRFCFVAVLVFMCFYMVLIDFHQRFDDLKEEERNRNWEDTSLKILRSSAVNSVVFIKTHKTASSTVANILNRYADTRNITMAIPFGKWHRFNWPALFHRTSASHSCNKSGGKTEPGFLVNHARYDHINLKVVFPHPDTKFITILRHPAEQLRSVFHYEGFSNHRRLVNISNPFLTFISSPEQFIGKSNSEVIRLLFNPQSFDLGIGEFTRFYSNISLFDEEIQRLEFDFDLVLITEYFDESLLLMKKEFGWRFEDLIYMKFLDRGKPKEQIVSKDEIKLLQDALSLRIYFDLRIYNYFLEILHRKIKLYGPSFEGDLEYFRELNRNHTRLCTNNKYKLEKGKYDKKAKVKIHLLNNNLEGLERDFCRKLTRDEIEYLLYFKRKQRCPLSKHQISHIQRSKTLLRSSKKIKTHLNKKNINRQ